MAIVMVFILLRVNHGIVFPFCAAAPDLGRLFGATRYCASHLSKSGCMFN